MSSSCDKESRNYYQYYDTPDGCDIHKKIGCCVRYGASAGFLLGVADVLYHSRATGFANTMKRFAVHMVPLSLMGATFAAVTNGMQLYREKDSILNYFLGGLACGPIVAAYGGSKLLAFPAGVLLGIGAMAKKESVNRCVPILFPDLVQPMTYSVFEGRHDYTIASDPKDDLHTFCAKDAKDCKHRSSRTCT